MAFISLVNKHSSDARAGVPGALLQAQAQRPAGDWGHRVTDALASSRLRDGKRDSEKCQLPKLLSLHRFKNSSQIVTSDKISHTRAHACTRDSWVGQGPPRSPLGQCDVLWALFPGAAPRCQAGTAPAQERAGKLCPQMAEHLEGNTICYLSIQIQTHSRTTPNTQHLRVPDGGLCCCCSV